MPKDPDIKQPADGGYGGSYGSYGSYGGYAGYSAGYGYGEGGTGGGAMQRTLKDYLLILRERIWYVVVVFLVVFSSSLVFTLSETKIYSASASVQVLRNDPNVVQIQQVIDNDIHSTEDLNTQIKLLESASMARLVADIMSPEDRKAFLAPFPAGTTAASIPSIINGNKKISQRRLSMILDIGYRHSDRNVAAKIANLYVEVYLQYNASQQKRESKDAVKTLDDELKDKQANLEKLRKDLLQMREEHGNISLDESKDLVTAALRVADNRASETAFALSGLETRRSQILDYQARKADLSELPFLASQGPVSTLIQAVNAAKIDLAGLSQRYKPKHPEMVTLLNALAEKQALLASAIDKAIQQFDADYRAALENNRIAQAELQKKKQASYELEHDRIVYTQKESELKVQEQQLNNMLTRRNDVDTISKITSQNARALDAAVPPPESRPEYPRVSFNLGMGMLGGLGLGLAFAFFVAFIDDRVKSSFDIEGVVGLPLIGIIPQIKRMEQADKAQIVVNNADRQVAEAFLTLHSSLRLKDESKNAKVVLTTSTIPGEGKSFISTNLALTFAAHGEKVAIVDCDLRKPNIHKSFRIDNLKGVIDICAGKATIDEVIVKGPNANVDIIPTGGRAKNPTQILNSKAFELLISDLRKRYDRVFVDTPPLAAVSDALIILPLVDGSIFTIYFNKVRRKAAQFAAKRLTEANVPNFGAVLNGLNLAVSGYYYAQYYDKSYKDYYVVMAKDDETSKEK